MTREELGRVQWIDVAKSIGIFFIVFGHVCKANYETNPARIFSFSFNAQVFFALSGLTFLGIDMINSSKMSKECLKFRMHNWFSRIIIPYIVWSMISIIFYWGGVKLKIISTGDNRIIPNILGMVYGNSNSNYFRWNRPLWFLTCLISTYLLWFITLKALNCISCFRGHEKLFIIGAISIVFLVGGLMNKYELDFILPWHIETAICVYPLFGIGILCKAKHCEVNDKKGKIQIYLNLCFGILLFIVSLLLGASQIFTDLRQGIFNGYFRFYLVSIFMSFACISFAKAINKCAFLSYIGKRTLPILLMHKFPILFFQTICPIVKDYLESGSLAVEAIVTIAVIGLCLIGEKVFAYLCPVAIGMKRVN